MSLFDDNDADPFGTDFPGKSFLRTSPKTASKGASLFNDSALFDDVTDADGGLFTSLPSGQDHRRSGKDIARNTTTSARAVSAPARQRLSPSAPLQRKTAHNTRISLFDDDDNTADGFATTENVERRAEEICTDSVDAQPDDASHDAVAATMVEPVGTSTQGVEVDFESSPSISLLPGTDCLLAAHQKKKMFGVDTPDSPASEYCSLRNSDDDLPKACTNVFTCAHYRTRKCCLPVLLLMNN